MWDKLLANQGGVYCSAQFWRCKPQSGAPIHLALMRVFEGWSQNKLGSWEKLPPICFHNNAVMRTLFQRHVPVIQWPPLSLLPRHHIGLSFHHLNVIDSWLWDSTSSMSSQAKSYSNWAVCVNLNLPWKGVLFLNLILYRSYLIRFHLKTLFHS